MLPVRRAESRQRLGKIHARIDEQVVSHPDDIVSHPHAAAARLRREHDAFIQPSGRLCEEQRPAECDARRRHRHAGLVRCGSHRRAHQIADRGAAGENLVRPEQEAGEREEIEVREVVVGETFGGEAVERALLVLLLFFFFDGFVVVVAVVVDGMVPARLEGAAGAIVHEAGGQGGNGIC